MGTCVCEDHGFLGRPVLVPVGPVAKGSLGYASPATA